MRKTHDRKNHRWEEVPDGDGLNRCKYCGAFRKRTANVYTGFSRGDGFQKRQGDVRKWVDKYAPKGQSRWQDFSPECV